jgi:hypothetical protein
MTAAIKSLSSIKNRSRSRSTRKPAVAPKNSKVTPISRSRRAQTGPALPNYSVAEPAQPGPKPRASAIKVLPNLQWQPLWLRSLLGVQRASTVAVVLLLGGALSLYGLTVYGEQRWTLEYQKLETLRRSEQQLSAASEVLKHQLAKEAENPKTGLAPQKPSETIFLPPVPESRSPQAEQVPNSEPARKHQAAVETPLGY